VKDASKRIEFTGHSGARLAARLDLPDGPVHAFALFAHCFTCSKDLGSVRQIAAALNREGIAVLRFDFTGLGGSDGDFAATNFSSNVTDLECAADYLRANFEAPAILIGHSLGGAAILSLAAGTADARAVVTIGAPADTAHVLHNLGASVATIEREGAAEVLLAGRTFTIEQQFVEDVRHQKLLEQIEGIRTPLLVLHAPLDQIVGIENAAEIFAAAKHPKSFISLDGADHLLSNPADATYAGNVIAAWASRYLVTQPEDPEMAEEAVIGTETGEGKFQNLVSAGSHRLFADEPVDVGGLASGPTPYDYLAIALGACTSMTLRLYAEHKKLELGTIRVEVSHDKLHARDCAECSEEQKSADARIDRFTRRIIVQGPMGEQLQGKILEIADKCPVHRTLSEGALITSVLGDADTV
jgi:putative redox protein